MKKLLKNLTIMLIIVLILSVGLDELHALWRDLSFNAAAHSQAELTVKSYANDHGLCYSDYPESLIQLLERNPETEAFVLEYPIKKDAVPVIDLSEYAGSDDVPLFLQWDQRWGYIQYGSDVAGLTGCGPVCLSMAAYYITGDSAMTPDRIIRFALENGYCIPGDGTSWSLISEGGMRLGLDVTEIPLVESRIYANLEAGNPIICVMGPGDFTTSGHYIVMVGLENGLIRVNDPNSIANSQKLWDYDDISSQIRNLWVIRSGNR